MADPMPRRKRPQNVARGGLGGACGKLSGRAGADADEVALLIGFPVSEESRGINSEAIRVLRGSDW
jgi:hypothetical protein